MAFILKKEAAAVHSYHRLPPKQVGTWRNSWVIAPAIKLGSDGTDGKIRMRKYMFTRRLCLERKNNYNSALIYKNAGYALFRRDYQRYVPVFLWRIIGISPAWDYFSKIAAKILEHSVTTSHYSSWLHWNLAGHY